MRGHIYLKHQKRYVRKQDIAEEEVPAVRTKYDRMFERTNQSILTPHYSALISHENGDDADDVFTLARRDHALDGDNPVEDRIVASEDLSKRKLRAGTSRKAQLKNRPAPDKVIFDDEGQPREFYEFGKDAETGAAADAERKKYVDEERGRMQAADRVDREVARERKMEKRKRKGREREVCSGL